MKRSRREEKDITKKNKNGNHIVEIKHFDQLIPGEKYIVVKEKDALSYLADTPDEDDNSKILEFKSQTHNQVIFKDLKNKEVVYNKPYLISNNGKINIWEIQPLPSDISALLGEYINKNGGKYKKTKKTRRTGRTRRTRRTRTRRTRKK